MNTTFKTLATAACIASCAALSPSSPAQAGLNPYLGEIMLFGGTFCPRGWSDLDGKLLPIASNSALFSVLGTTYGGDGRTTFGKPDLRSRLPIGIGQGPGLSGYRQGQRSGQETTPVTMPRHTHDTVVKPMAVNSQASRQDPDGAFLANPVNENIYIGGDPAVKVEMSPDSLIVTETAKGTSTPVDTNIPPVLALRFCIATQGTHPSRN